MEKKKSSITLAKITKLVYVYKISSAGTEGDDELKFIGTFSTVECSKIFKLGKDTLSKYLNSGLPFKGNIYSRIPLHKE